MQLPDFDEASATQIPALIQLVNLGYSYISRQDMANLREHSGQYILRSIARAALARINDISSKGIEEAILALETPTLDDGIYKASESIFTNILSGKGVSEIVNGKVASPQLRFIDWENPQNNTFHVCAEFELAEESNRRPDIVLFVNGIPFAVIENKKPSVPVADAVNQMLRNQKGNQTPRFFLYPQILLCSNGREAKYGTMLTPANFYSNWQEKDPSPTYAQDVLNSVNTNIDQAVLKSISHDLVRQSYRIATKQEPSAQDKAIYSLLSPARLLDLVRNFIVYDNGIKKIARYPQYFAIKKTLNCIENRDEFGKREGGLIWHTQGSGKSLSMVMLVKHLIENVQNPRIIVVTDRRDLDDQIRGTFENCSIKTGVKQATSKEHLLKLIKKKTLDVVTTLVHKFEKSAPFVDNDDNIFLLIDEAHRTHGGDANAAMNHILPMSCQIAFTGTPLLRKEKSAKKFGRVIDAYTISEAEADGAILPLIYQGRFVEQVVNPAINKFYDKITANFSPEQRKDFEKKCLSPTLLEETSRRIEMIALDIHEHFSEHFHATGLKGQIVAPSKYCAVMFKKALDMLGGLHTEVIISESQFDEGQDQMPEHKKAVAEFLQEEKRLHGSLDSREKRIIKDYKKNPDGCELLIVVDKLLTGFDAPCDTVLYLAKILRDHNLLQAIARVNRLYEGAENKKIKSAGLIVDYSKNAKNLKDALGLFSNYDAKDIEKALLNTDEQIAELEAQYHNLHGMFAGIKDKDNTDAYVQSLVQDEAKKNAFYEGVNKFIRSFDTCFTLYDFHQKFDSKKLAAFRMDLKRFVEIKKITQLSLAEKVDFSKYKDQLHTLLDDYVTAQGVEVLSKEISLSNMGEFNQFIEDEKNGLSKRSRAAGIAAQTSKVISERYKQDEVFYKHFSDRIKALLEQLAKAKMEDIKSILQEIKDIQTKVNNYEDADLPEGLRSKKALHPFYRNTLPLVEDKLDKDELPQVVTHMVEILRKHRVVDWWKNSTVKRTFIIDAEDYLLDDVQSSLSAQEAHDVAAMCWEIAVQNKDTI